MPPTQERGEHCKRDDANSGKWKENFPQSFGELGVKAESNEKFSFNLLKIPSGNGGFIEISGSLNTIPVSQNVKSSIKNSKQSMNCLESVTRGFIEDCDLLEGLEEEQSRIAVASAAATICTLPKAENNFEGAKWLCSFFATFFIYDDLLEKEILNRGSLAEIRNISKCILDQMKSDETIDFVGEFPEGKKILQAVWKLRMLAKHSFPDFERSISRLVDEMGDYLNSNPWRREMVDDLEYYSFASAFNLRLKDSAIRMTIGAGEFVSNCKLPEDIYKSPVFGHLTDIVTGYLVLSNDLFGLQRDCKEKNLNMLIFIASKKQIQISEAVVEVVNMMDELLEDFEITKRKLRKIYGGDKNLSVSMNTLSRIMYCFQTQYAKIASSRYLDGAEFAKCQNDD